MLLISHVTLSDYNSNLESVVSNAYSLKWHESTKNNENKKQFMFYKGDYCDIFYYTANGSIDLEVITYDNYIDSNNCFIKKLSGNRVIITSNRIHDSISFWNEFGFSMIETEQGERFLTSRNNLRNFEFIIQLDYDPSNHDSYLDCAGPSCISFLSTNLAQDHDKFKETYHTTKIEEIILNGKTIKFFFVKSFSGEIAEVFSI